MAKSPKNTGVRVHHAAWWLDVIERARSLPRAYFVPNARAVENPDDILDLLGKPRFRARRQVLLETSQGAVTRRGGKSTPKKATVNIRTPDPETVLLEVFTGQPGFVVLTDSWYPGWRVTVDGREAKLYRANYLFRAVEVDAGHSTVAFRYEPESFYKGAQISGAFLLAILLSGAWLVFRRQREFQVGIDP